MGLNEVNATLRQIRSVGTSIRIAVIIADGRLIADPPTLITNDDVVEAMVESWLGLGSKLVATFLSGGLVEGSLTSHRGSLRLLPIRDQAGIMFVMEGTGGISAEVQQLVRMLAGQL